MKRDKMSLNSLMKAKNPCLLHPFRTITGYCNNPLHPEWGTSFRALRRILPPDYDDGISLPRQKSRVDLNSLPNARQISRTIHSEKNSPSKIFTHMVMQFGQFIDHDIGHTPTAVGPFNREPKCCGEEKMHPDCLPIEISESDGYFSQYNVTCHEFVRSLAASRPGCKLGPREQMNQLTAFIDASMIYGSTEDEESFLRSFQDGGWDGM